MNNARRKEIAAVKARIEEMVAMRDEIIEQINTIAEAEQEYFDNMPDSFRDGDKGEKADTAISRLQEASSDLEILDFDGIIESLNEAAE